MSIKLSDHFSYKRILRWTKPSMFAMVITSIYGVVDGFFVSNYAGEVAFTALNFIMPYVILIGCIGSMLGTGGSALIGKKLGEDDRDAANRIFTMIVVISFTAGVVVSILSFIFIEDIALFLGASNLILKDCIIYAKILFISLPFYILQYEFHSFAVIAEKPKLDLKVTIIAGITNVVLDYIFIVRYNMGITGAALGTVMSEIFGGGLPLLYFIFNKNLNIKFTKFSIDFVSLLDASTNGLSEFISNISMNIVSMLYNAQLMKYVGEKGVAAYGVLMYLNFIFASIFFGFSIGTAGPISFNYGAENTKELKSLFKKCCNILFTFGICMFILAEILAVPLSKSFVGYDKELYELALSGFRIFAFSFLLCYIPIFGSSFFTALNNGLISFLISFIRTMIFQVASVMILPLFLGITGVWLSIVFAELVAAIMTIIFLIMNAKKYEYI